MSRHASGLCLCTLVACLASAQACAPDTIDGARSAPAMGRMQSAGAPAPAAASGDQGSNTGKAQLRTVLLAATNVDADTAGAVGVDNSPIWWRSQAVKNVHGQVFDAATGIAATQPAYVMVYTPCAGMGCQSEIDPYNQVFYSAEVKNGEFSFGPDAALTLRPDTVFFIKAEGYDQVAIAHGPGVPLENEKAPFAPDRVPTVYLCEQAADDRDHDGICTDAELAYGTDPDEQDTDGDALSDTLELYGHELQGVAPPFYDLMSIGADPRHRDVFVAIRHTASSKLIGAAFAPVQASFDAAPLTNWDEKPGVHLHILWDRTAITGADDVPQLVLGSSWGDFEILKNKYFKARPLAFHYALFANMYDNALSSGVSRGWGASDLVVAGGMLDGSAAQLGATLMHELGHNLGLHHGGHSDENWLPHYTSIMNYAYQFSGITRGGKTTFDYSRIEIRRVDESMIDETKPFLAGERTTPAMLEEYSNLTLTLDASENFTQRHLVGTLHGPLELDGVEGHAKVAVDLNANGKTTDKFPATRNDWASLIWRGGSTGAIGDFAAVNTHARFAITMPPCPLPRVATVVTGQAQDGAFDDESQIDPF